MPNTTDPFDPRAGSKVDPRDPWSTPGAPRVRDPYAAGMQGGDASVSGGSEDVAPPGRETRDPGSSGAGRIAWLVAIVLFCLTIALNQCSGPAKPPGEASAPSADSNPQVMVSAMMIKAGRAFNSMQAGSSSEMLRQIDQAAGAAAEPMVERVRAAIAAAELVGPEEAMSRLDAVRGEIEIDRVSGAPALEPEAADELVGDIDLLRAIYGGAGGPIPGPVSADSLTQDERERLVNRHGRLGRIALTFGRPESDPERARLVGGGELLVGALLVFAGALVVVIPLSFVCMVIAIMRMSRPGARRAFAAPMPGGSVYIEMLAVFMVAFLLLKVGLGIVASVMGPNADEGVILQIGLIAQWPVALAAFWPLVRGVSLKEHAQRLGWTRGKGIMREVLAGVFCYLAGLPLVMAAFAIVFIGIVVQSAIRQAAGEPPETPHNPILDIATSGGLAPILLFMLATIWAPFTEEAIFRGGLYRHLRSRVGVLVAAVCSALFFGLIHGYSPLLLLPVIALGFNFALMREWRGSLIAPIVAHALHNGTIMSVLLFFVAQVA
ncbi:MAG: CPBP family intramembrane metalloprotease [Phycisphaeraceae bacterium]|nr:CPBP family intramembrane metalloprotease [Phycisphaeraceae bacterium]